MSRPVDAPVTPFRPEIAPRSTPRNTPHDFGIALRAADRAALPEPVRAFDRFQAIRDNDQPRPRRTEARPEEADRSPERLDEARSDGAAPSESRTETAKTSGTEASQAETAAAPEAADANKAAESTAAEQGASELEEGVEIAPTSEDAVELLLETADSDAAAPATDDANVAAPLAPETPGDTVVSVLAAIASEDQASTQAKSESPDLAVAATAQDGKARRTVPLIALASAKQQLGGGSNAATGSDASPAAQTPGGLLDTGAPAGTRAAIWAEADHSKALAALALLSDARPALASELLPLDVAPRFGARAETLPSAAPNAGSAGVGGPDAQSGLKELPRPTPLPLLAVEVGMQAVRGATRFAIRLDPAELGRVEVTLNIKDKGEVSASLVVDRVETLALLKREAATLEQAFEQAGLRKGEDGLQFSLRDQRGEGSDGGFGSGKGEHAEADVEPVIDLRRVFLPSSRIDLII